MINLTDLKPNVGKFILEGKEHAIRPLTLNDEIWLRKEFSQDVFASFMEGNPNFEVIARIVYHQLDDKSDFVAQETVDYDDEGNEIKSKIGGWKLFASKMIGHEIKIDIVNALNVAMGISKEIMDKIDTEKKNLTL